MDPLLMTILIFVLVAGLAGAVALVFRDRGATGAEQRLQRMVATASQAEIQGENYIKSDVLKPESVGFSDWLKRSIPSFNKLFEQADVNIQPSVLVSIGILLGVFGGLASWLMGTPLPVVPLAAIIMFTLPFFWLLNKRRQRLKAFGAQLPDALELVARALRAGHALNQGMKVCADEMPDPIAKEFGRVFAEQNLGISVEEALRNMCDRVPNLDLRFFVTSVNIQRQTGGDLAEILDKIGYIIRQRFQILGQVKALTGEGRFSGVILIALPFVLFFAILHLNYEYARVLWTHPKGINMALWGLGLQVAGALTIKKIVNIKV